LRSVKERQIIKSHLIDVDWDDYVA
jgi:hypothetical protein